MKEADRSAGSLLRQGPESIQRQLAQDGLHLDLGLVRLRICTREASVARQLFEVYRHYVPLQERRWCDLQVSLMRAQGLRGWLRPQVRFFTDGAMNFDAFPADHGLPLLEWGVNWLIGRRMNDVLLLHAGTLERDGRALVMPALPGSGKSTLTAALSLRGWRLLSDEFGAFDPQAGTFRAVLKPVALKNESIGVIRSFEPGAELGPSFDKTRKGTVAHLAPSPSSVARVHEGARPGMLVLPRWQAGSPTLFEPVPPTAAFTSLAFNAFNYAVLGAEGFQAVTALVRGMPAWRLVYSDLEDATSKLLGLWQQQAWRPWPPLRPQEVGLPAMAELGTSA